ncbi:hypothetical protein [Rugosimonospora africana]|uniref:Fibronectin type-III domain-containing protein n=1 Tax=Rugosimonospora africana TaxID=556532 RepID=A0A8J3R1T1_9ACTN|nr:hypothetical protein [Rugosimonospora africana]GIH18636.1 hypothetical protein Raf01_68080 [Rugosimonospora africana]
MTERCVYWARDQHGVTFRLENPIDHPEFAWPETLLGWPVRWAEPSVPAGALRLVDERAEPVPFQLSCIELVGDRLSFAVVRFFAALEPGQVREFRLSADPSVPLAPPAGAVSAGSLATGSVTARPVTVTRLADSLVVDTGAIQVRLPCSQAVGRSGDVGGADVPGPILQLNRGRGWVGRSSLRVGRARVERIDVREVEAGPLTAAFEIGYRFAGGARYTATVRFIQGYDFVELTEETSGIDELDVGWELSWDGFAPTHRFSSTWPYSQDADDYLDPGSPETYRWPGIADPLAVADSGEDPSFSGPGGTEAPGERYAFTVGPYAPSYAWDIRPHATFWDVHTCDSAGLFVRHPEHWDDRRYASWTSARDLQVRFRYDGRVLHWTWPVRDGTRRTGIAFYDHDLDREVLRAQRCHAAALADRYGISAEAARLATRYQSTHVRYLYQWHSTLDLDRVKDWTLTYEGRRPAPLWSGGECPGNECANVECSGGEFRTARRFLTALFTGPEGPRLIAHGVNELAGYLNIGQRPLYDRLLDGCHRLGDRLDPADRRRVDALLLLTGYVSAGEEIGPMLRMFGGHPNFMADGKAALACLAWLYPEHPAARDWLDQFETFVRLAGVFHTRPALPGRAAKPGRWTESLATYVWAFLRPATLGNALGIRADGHNRLCTPEFAALGDWLVGALSAPVMTRPVGSDGSAGGSASPGGGSVSAGGGSVSPGSGSANPGGWVNWGGGWAGAGGLAGSGDSATAEGALRMHPTQGAHAHWPRRPPIEMRLLGEALRRYRPLVAEHLLWGCGAAGARLDQRPGTADPWRVLHGPADDRGTNPRLRSAKYTGYGIILRAAVDSPDEVSVHLQQTDPGPNYRWGIADDNGSGHLYYYARGRAYSGHGPEDAGDRRVPDATFVSSCGVWKDGAIRSLGQNTLDRPFYDLGAAQYAEITPSPDSPVHGQYLSRSVILVGSDYLVTYDAVAGTQRVVWTWTTLTRSTATDANSVGHVADRMPFIHVVRGVGASDAAQNTRGEVSTPLSRGLRLEDPEAATGNTLAVVSHRDDLAVDGLIVDDPAVDGSAVDGPAVDPQRQAPWGARIVAPHGVDYVFRYEAGAYHQPAALDVDEDGLRFAGTAGVIRLLDSGERQLVLFHGTSIGTRDVCLSTVDHNLGVSLTYRDTRRLSGRFSAPTGNAPTGIAPTGNASAGSASAGSASAGSVPAGSVPAGSVLTLRVPAGLDGAVFYVDGAPVRPTRATAQELTVALPAGTHEWELTRGAPCPVAAEVLRTENVSGGALVHFTTVAAAEEYFVRVSEDGGTTWATVGAAHTSPYRLTGLTNGRKVHLRIVAANAEHRAPSGADYPLHVSDQPPAAPDGLSLRLSPGTVALTWGEVLGASGYRVLRRRRGQTGYRQVFSGFAFAYLDRNAYGVEPPHGDPLSQPDGTEATVYEYAVAAENLNGAGEPGTPVDTDPRGWRHWRPPVPLVFRRRHTYHEPPYRRDSVIPEYYDDQAAPPELPSIAELR